MQLEGRYIGEIGNVVSHVAEPEWQFGIYCCSTRRLVKFSDKVVSLRSPVEMDCAENVFYALAVEFTGYHEGDKDKNG